MSSEVGVVGAVRAVGVVDTVGVVGAVGGWWCSGVEGTVQWVVEGAMSRRFCFGERLTLTLAA